MWRPCVVFLGLAISAAASSNSVVISSYSNGVIGWEDVYTTGAYHVEWASELPGVWTNSWGSLQDMPATGGLMQASVPMFYRVLYSPPSLFEDFEDDGGWSDHPAGDWTEDADTGIWTTYLATGPSGGFVFARSDCANAHSGQRYIGVETNIPGVLKFPALGHPDLISYWVKGTTTGGGSAGTVSLEYSNSDQTIWATFHQVQVNSPDYVEVSANTVWEPPISPPYGYAPPGVRFRFDAEVGAAICVDDVTVTPWPN